MLHTLKKRLNPACYQGQKRRSQHFEGWYFKIIDNSAHHLYAIIPGIFIAENKSDSHSFIQVFDGVTNISSYFKFPLTDFSSKDYIFSIQISENLFTENLITLNLKNDALEIAGELHFSDLTPWPKTLIAPGIMGWYSWVPFMECYHGIVSLNHNIQGTLQINSKEIDFSNGLGYTEKDWGQSFPEAWIWCQSNHFNSKNISITGSIAIIPWIRKPFLGFIFGIWHNNRLYRFTTYTGAKLTHLHIAADKIQCALEQKGLLLEIIMHRKQGGFLQAPTIKGMTHQISESLQAWLEVRLTDISKKQPRLIFEDRGKHAGFEIAGDVQRLLDMYK